MAARYAKYPGASGVVVPHHTAAAGSSHTCNTELPSRRNTVGSGSSQRAAAGLAPGAGLAPPHATMTSTNHPWRHSLTTRSRSRVHEFTEQLKRGRLVSDGPWDQL